MDELEKLQAQIADLQRKAEDLAAQKKAAVLNDMRAKIKAYGITAKDLGFTGSTSKAGAVVPVKYRHPQDHSLEWTGRGRQPKWMVAYLEAGGTMEALTLK